jgi:hypothetical protein
MVPEADKLKISELSDKDLGMMYGWWQVAKSFNPDNADNWYYYKEVKDELKRRGLLDGV